MISTLVVSNSLEFLLQLIGEIKINGNNIAVAARSSTEMPITTVRITPTVRESLPGPVSRYA